MPKRSAKGLPLAFILSLVFVLILGGCLGAAMGATLNIIRTENFTEFKSDLPSKLYDIKGRLITEFFAEEKRNPVPLRDLPPSLVGAFLTREDKTFYSHRGFSLKSFARAFIGRIIGRNLGGGSTITQQVAGDIYADRHEITLRRKLIELWWSLQVERRYSKQEILEMYLNRTVMGSGGVYGVEAASQYLFGHPAKDCSPAESAIITVQLSSPTLYNPFKNPTNAKARSKVLLDKMVSRGVVEGKEADASFKEYWDNFDYTRVASSAYFMREDKAPWFSEYVRRELENLLYGSLDLYSDGLSVYTTLDLDQQAAADTYMKRGIERANASYQRASSQRLTEAETSYTPLVELLGMAFNLTPLAVSSSKGEAQAYQYYQSKLNPSIDVLALLFGINDLKLLSNAGTVKIQTDLEKTTVEGSLVTIDNETGYITALIGGSNYSSANQLIRATQSKIMPGSTFKPLYYSAAIDSKKITEGTMIYDAPTIFYSADGTPYIPTNFKGEWKGTVLAWRALASSMNVPSVKILETVGFDQAIQRAAALLGITDPEEIRRTFPRVYPLGLGVISVTPLKMTRAFSVFANGGKAVTPISIRYVEDRNGNTILEPEKDAQKALEKMGSSIQIVSSQNAAVMTDMLQRVTASGTLAGWGTALKQTGPDGVSYTIPLAGKTGTTVNWADAWTVGFSPYYTTAIWFGFDMPGNSLGVEQTGATIAGPIWADFMRDIHKGLPYKAFPGAQSGLVNVKVCAVSGLLPTEFCKDGLVDLLYLDGTQPVASCNIHTDEGLATNNLLNIITGQNQGAQQGKAQSGSQGTSGGTLVPNLDSTIKIDLP
ncbi:MAG: PBP1A family penicillin-binding protein [Spirochaetes bacterium]|nr:PBP1A family penicillin-binding protein [Spirochaetota bacterium]